MDSKWKFLANDPTQSNSLLHAWKTAHSELTRVYALIKWFHNGRVRPDSWVSACTGLLKLAEDGAPPVAPDFHDLSFTDWKLAATKQGSYLGVIWGSELQQLQLSVAWHGVA
jgi:hypothetical protein